MVLLFIIGQLYFTVIGIEVSPWRNYGMYSEPRKQPTINAQLVIDPHGKEYHYERHLGDLRTEVLIAPFESFLRVYKNGKVDPNAAIFDRKFSWLPGRAKRYARTNIVHSRSSLDAFAKWFPEHFEAVTDNNVTRWWFVKRCQSAFGCDTILQHVE